MIFYRSPRLFTQVRALSFDLDDTLYDNEVQIHQAEAKLLTYLQQTYPTLAEQDASYWQGHKRKILAQRPELRSDMSLLRRLILERGLSAAGISGKALTDGVQAAFDFFYWHRSDFQVAPDILAVLETLAAKVPLVAITNGNVNLEQIGLNKVFAHCYKASLAQPMKPHACMFDLAAQQLQLAPSHILHVGDNLVNDIQGAVNAGYLSAWYAEDRPMDLRREPVLCLPHVQLTSLVELTHLIG